MKTINTKQHEGILIMANLNHITLAGHLTRDPELRMTPNGTPVATLGVAVNHRWRQGDAWKEDICYIDCTVFGGQAESAAAHLFKGSPVLVDGRLRFRSWETQDGQKRSKHDIVTSNVQFLPRGSGTMPFTPASGEDGDEVPF